MNYLSNPAIRSAPAGAAFAITTNNAQLLPQPAKALYIGTGGDIRVAGQDGVAVTFRNVPDGFILPLACVQVFTTGTTASNIVGLYL